ncbi:MAG: hypothetical protein M5U31_10040 [Acidimicrobiia bacterium]|nr:hypothetical protein [Acidimicrobiia bacterium]
MSRHAPVLAPRRCGVLAVVLALGLGAVAFTASPADAATPGYLGSNAPLGWNGNTYDDPPPGETGTGAVYVSDSGDFSFVDEFPFGSITGVTGNSNLHVALAKYNDGAGDQYVTVYVSNQWLQDAPGNPHPATCEGVDDAVFGGDPACEAFKADILTANGPGNDFSYTGTSGFVDALNDPASDAYTLGEDPAVVWPDYQGTASPFAYDGADFSGDFWGGSAPGSMWLGVGGPPSSATSEPIALADFPGVGQGGEIFPAHLALLESGPLRITMAIDGGLFSAFDPMNPFSADCAGLQDFLAMVGQSGIDCVAFRTNVWAPPASVGEQYTCAADWYTGWTDGNGDAIDPSSEPTIIDGFDLPALTPIGTDTGPGVCTAATPPNRRNRPHHRGPTIPARPLTPTAPAPAPTPPERAQALSRRCPPPAPRHRPCCSAHSHCSPPEPRSPS